MTLPHDRETLLAAWEEIGSSQPLPTETHEILLGYFRHAALCGDHTGRMFAPAEYRIDQSLPPPTRFVRQPRSNGMAPCGPDEAQASSFNGAKSPSTLSEAEQPPLVVYRNSIDCETGPQEDL